MEKSWRQTEWLEKEKENKDKWGASEKQREKLRDKDQYSPKLEDVFFGQKPIPKISQGCKFHSASGFVCSDEKEDDGKDKK